MKVQEEVGVRIGIDYPKPIVNEQESAKVAKERVSAVRKEDETKKLAQQVYQKHGSRSSARPDGVPGSPAKKTKMQHSQPSIKAHFPVAAKNSPSKSSPNLCNNEGTKIADNRAKEWSCTACTFLNDKPSALACEVCGTERPRQSFHKVHG